MVSQRPGVRGTPGGPTGVAISPGGICALAGDWQARLDPPPSDNGHWPALAVALSDLAARIGGAGSLSVSLMPPFTEVRRLELPPLADEELQRVLARNAAKYFVNARGPQMVGVSRVGRRQRGAGSSPVIAAAAPARIVSLIRAAAEKSGWTIDSIAPAENAWVAAGVAMWPAFAKQAACLLVAHEDRTDLLQLVDGRLAGVRRFRAGGADAALIVDTVGPSARVGAVGEPQARRELAAALSALRLTVATSASQWSATAERADVLAAQFAGRDTGPVLRGEDMIAGDQARLRRTTRNVAIAAAALLVVSALIELWGVHRQLRQVREERAKLRPALASTLVGRTTVDAVYRHLATLSAAERAAPRWSAVIGRLSESIPEDAYLLGIRARQDSIVVDGLADHAARVFDAIEKTPGIIEVKAAAPVRRELQEGGGDALEHFMIAARVAPVTTGRAATTPALNSGARRPAQ